MPIQRYTKIKGVPGRLMMDPWARSRRPLGKKRILDEEKLTKAVHYIDHFEDVEQIVLKTLDIERAIAKGDLKEVHPGLRILAVDIEDAEKQLPKAVQALEAAKDRAPETDRAPDSNNQE